MDPLPRNQSKKNYDPECVDVLTLAERELAAFFGAVKELFGTERAERSAQDWLHELESRDSLPTSMREWRSVTAKIMSELARQVTPSCLELVS
jgi:hypothetical protein